MKKYNIQNYIRYKNDVKVAVERLKNKSWEEYNRNELTIKFSEKVFNFTTSKWSNEYYGYDTIR